MTTERTFPPASAGRGLPPSSPKRDGEEDLQKLIDEINRFHTAMGIDIIDLSNEPVASLSSRLDWLRSAMARPGGPVLMGPRPTEKETQKAQAEANLLQREIELGISQPEAETTRFGEIPPIPTEDPPPGFEWRWNPSVGRYEPRKIAELTPGERATAEFRRQQADLDEAFRQEQLGFQQSQQAQAQQQFQASLAFQQEQVASQQGLRDREIRAQLAANPISWLQFAAFTGEQPVVQPWMAKLGFQDQGLQGLEAGQPLPGVQLGEDPSFAGLPALTRPSAQFLARAGPTAKSQFLGFRRARTGATPEETRFKLRSAQAPSGRFPGFSRFR